MSEIELSEFELGAPLKYNLLKLKMTFLFKFVGFNKNFVLVVLAYFVIRFFYKLHFLVIYYIL